MVQVLTHKGSHWFTAVSSERTGPRCSGTHISPADEYLSVLWLVAQHIHPELLSSHSYRRNEVGLQVFGDLLAIAEAVITALKEIPRTEPWSPLLLVPDLKDCP